MRFARTRVAAGVAVLAITGAVVAVAVFAGRATGPATALGAPHFVDETRSSGLDHTYRGSFAFATGGGVAAFDCNDDGKPELYVAGGEAPAALFRNDSPVGGSLRFSRVADPVTGVKAMTGAYPLDIDGDGVIDLAVLRAGGNVLLHGLGECRFEPGNDRWSFDGGRSLSTAFSATWEPGNDLPTLAVGNYLGLDASGGTTLSCTTNALYRPAPAWRTYPPSTDLFPGYCALSMLFSDWDRSGRRDLRVTNDREYYTDGEDQLFRIAGTAAPRAYSDTDGWRSMQIWGMGIASHDLTGDGYPEFFLTSQGDNKLQALAAGPGTPSFRDIALKMGVTAAQPFSGGDPLPSTAWHPEFADVNNDGFVDLFVSKGNVDAQPDHAQRDPSNLLLGQADGSFREAAVEAGILSYARGRGAAVADLNLDGLLDLVEVNYRDPVRLWRSAGTGDAAGAAAMGHWLALRVSQPAPNHDGVGAWVEVRTRDTVLRRELTVGGGHSGGQQGWIHFGLGVADGADVRVQWPGGTWSDWRHVAADTFAIVDRGATAIRSWEPGG